MITKQEFDAFVKSYNKNPGEYTKDEMYEIGVMHKQLCNVDKDWKELVKRIGWSKSVEYYRCFIKSRQKKDGTLPKAKITEVAIENISNEDLNIEKQELIKQRARVREEWTQYRKILKDDSRLDSFKESLLEAISNLPKLPQITYTPKYSECETEAILMLSDLHIGVKCDNFYNKYSVEIAQKRLTKLVQDVINYCNINKVNTLNVVNLGDLIQGYIHTTARIEAELNVTNQIMTAANLISQVLYYLCQYVPNVVYRSVTDNHSRMTASFKDNIEEENFNKIIDWYLEMRLEGIGNLTFAKDNIDDSISLFTLENGKTVMSAHGHLESPDKVIDNFVGAIGKLPDYVLLSHFHYSRAKAYNGSMLFINGSIVGTEQYALSKRLFNKPEQTLLIFNEDNVLDVHINLESVK